MLVLAGCRDILSLDDVTPPPPGSEVTGRYVYRALSNNAEYKPMITEYPVQAFEATAALADGNVVDVAIEPDGTFAFHSNAQDDLYRLRFVTTRGTYEVQHTARHLELAGAIWSLDSQSVGDNTTITYALNDTPPSMNATPVLRSTGTWIQSPPGARISLDGYTFTWPVGYPRLRAERYDRLFFTFDDAGASGASVPYRTIVKYRTDDVTILNGTTNAVSSENNRVGLTSVQRTRCMRVRVDFATMIQRLQGAYSALGTMLANAWYVVDVPEPSLGFFGTHSVAYASDVGNIEGDIDFGDPFPGVNGYTAHVLFARTLKVGAATRTVAVGTVAYALPPTGSCGTPAPALPEIVLPSMTRIAGSDLAGAESMVTIDRSAPVPVEWSIASPGYVDYWQVSLLELTGTALDFGKTIAYSTVESSLVIAPSDLVVGKTYVLQIMPSVGFPGAVAGDLATRSYPALTHTFYSGTFTIAN